MRLISELKRQDKELKEIRLLNEELADSKPSLDEILEKDSKRSG